MPSTTGSLIYDGVGIKGIAIAAAIDAWLEAAVGAVAQHLGRVWISQEIAQGRD
jgi:hypothetical protein